MTPASGPGDWSAVDAHSDSDRFADYLGKATAMDRIKAYKARSHAHLGLEAGQRVLDVGCGIGDDAIAMAELVGPDGAVVGIDNSAAMIEQARSKTAGLPTVSVRVGDVYDLGFDTDHFDASRADRVFQHLERPDDALAELVRVTRPGGRVSVIDPDWRSMAMDTPGDESSPEGLLDPTYAIPRNPGMGRELYRRSRQAGLSQLSVDPFVLTTTDFDLVYDMAEFEAWTDRMQDDGAVTDEEVAAWISHVRTADEDGLFFASMPAYIVTGTVPG